MFLQTDIAQNNNKFYDMELSGGWGAEEYWWVFENFQIFQLCD